MIVSAYFRIPSKQPPSFYEPHLKRFFKGIPWPLIFFTTPDLVPLFKEWRGDLPIRFVEVDSVYEIAAFKKLGLDFWKEQCRIDPEKYHTPELCAVWYNKKEFVLEAIEMTNLDEPYIWCDAGCIRHDGWDLTNFGSRGVVPCDAILFQSFSETLPACPFFKFRDPFRDEYKGVAGAIIAGYKDAWNAYSALYDEVLAEYTKNGVCCNSDQYITASAANKNCIIRLIKVNDWFDFLKIL